MKLFQREQRSLFGEILDWMLAPLLLLWPMSVSITYLVAQGIAHRPYDRDLGEMARTLARRVVVESDGELHRRQGEQDPLHGSLTTTTVASSPFLRKSR